MVTFPSPPALFPDRDGVINCGIEYAHRPGKSNGCLASSKPPAANAAGLLVLVVTNRSGAARGSMRPRRGGVLYEGRA